MFRGTSASEHILEANSVNFLMFVPLIEIDYGVVQ